MDSKHSSFPAKRLKPESASAREDEGVGGSEKFTETEMELTISHILENIQNFTQLVSELLESGKSVFKELSDEFEERIIAIHKERIDKWQEEIKELRSLDASNQEANALLHNARFMLQNPHTHSST